MKHWLGTGCSSRPSGRTDRGQSAVIVAMFMVVFLGMAGLVIDVAREHVTERHLQTAADAAALAAAQELPGSSLSACTFSGSAAGSSNCAINDTNVSLAADGDNYNTSFGNVQTTATLECLSVASAGTPCETGSACPGQYGPAGTATNTGCNAIQVTEQTSVDPFFMSVLGFGAQAVSATATASLAGGAPKPLNVEILDDTTESMQCPQLGFGCPSGFTGATICGGLPTDVPSSVLNDLTQEDCAKAGIRALLTQLLPCSLQASCGSSPSTDQTTDPAGALDDVGLITFPGVTGLNQTAPDGKTPIDESDCTQNVGTSNVSYATNANYQIVPFSSDFRVSDTATSPDPFATLNPNSNLVKAVYWPGDGCPNGGYPISGGPTTSIGGGGSGDVSAANNNSTTAVAVGGSTTAVGSGITQGSSQNTVNTGTVGVVRGSVSTNQSSPLAISGGANGTSNDRRTTTIASGSSIQINRPQTRISGDFLLVTVTAEGAGVNPSASICPAAGIPGTWTLVDKQRVSGNVIQATYSSIRNTTTAETYTFNFWGGSCGNGGAVNLAASAVVLRYSNVSGVDTAKGVGGSIGGPTATNDSGSAPSTTWTASTTSYANSAIGSATWTGSTAWASFTPGTGQCTSFAACATTVTSGGTLTGATFTFTNTNFRTYNVTLQINGANAPAAGGNATCPVNAGGNSCTISGNWTVNTGDKIALAVQKTSGGSGSTTSAATDSATVTSGSNTAYVSLASSCVNTSATVCDDATVPAPGGSFTSANLTFGAPVPAGDSFTVTLYQNDASTGLTCTITATHTGCTNPITGTLALATGDSLELQVTRTAGTAAFTTTAATTAALLIGGTVLTAPPVTTAQPNEQVVSLFGTAATGFAAGSGLGVIASSATSTATGADDAPQATAGLTPGESVSSNAPANWVAQTVALQATLPSSIPLQTPAGYSAGNGLVIATVGVSNLPSGSSICTPATWNVLSTQGTAGTTATPSSGSPPDEVTQESFYTSQTTAAGTYTVNFRTNCANANTGVGVGASDVAVDYTGVDTTTPFDNVTPESATGSGTAPASPALTAADPTNSIDDTVVGLFATAANSLSTTGGVVENGSWVSTGINDQVEQQPGTVPSQTGSTAAAPWTAETVALRPALPMSITIPAVSGYSPTNGNNDLLLVSITARGLGSGTICAPDSTWYELATTSSGTGANQLTQTDFWTTASTTYAFTFNSSSTCQGNNLVAAAASAVATNYAGVSAVSVLAKATPNGGTPSKVLTAPDVTTQQPDSEVVSTFGTLDTWSSGTKPAVQNAPSPWVNSGADSALQPVAGDQTSPQQEQTNNAASWTGITVALSPLLNSSLTVTPPAGYVGGGSDLMLVTIAANNLGTGSICAPDSTWSRVPLATPGLDVYTVSSGTVTQAAFYTSTSEVSSDVFSFYAKPNCEGGPLGVGASAAAVDYTGVDTASPFDVTPVLASGSSATLQPGAITTTVAGDELVSLFGSGATSLNSTIAVAGNGLAPAGGVNNVNPPPQHNPGANTPASATSNASGAWTAETIALQPLLKTGIIVQRPPNPNAERLSGRHRHRDRAHVGQHLRAE